MIATLIGLPIVLAYIAIGAIWEGYALTILWGWFIVPAFGLPQLSIPFAMGVALVVGLMTTTRLGNEATDPDKGYAPFVTMLLRPAMVLLIGWIVTKFI